MADIYSKLPFPYEENDIIKITVKFLIRNSSNGPIIQVKEKVFNFTIIKKEDCTIAQFLDNFVNLFFKNTFCKILSKLVSISEIEIKQMRGFSNNAFVISKLLKNIYGEIKTTYKNTFEFKLKNKLEDGSTALTRISGVTENFITYDKNEVTRKFVITCEELFIEEKGFSSIIFCTISYFLPRFFSHLTKASVIIISPVSPNAKKIFFVKIIKSCGKLIKTEATVVLRLATRASNSNITRLYFYVAINRIPILRVLQMNPFAVEPRQPYNINYLYYAVNDLNIH